MAGKRRVVDVSIAISYLRVSTDEQALGPEAQRGAIARWCQGHGMTLVGEHEDRGISGGAALDKRPGLLAALEDLRARRAGVLLVAKRDRLARDVVVAATIERLVEREGARVRAADGTGYGDGPEAGLMRGIIDVFAEYERGVIRARTKAALAVKKARGELVGQPLYGQRVGVDGVHLEPDEHEQVVLVEIDRLRAMGLAVRAIAAQLDVGGFRPRGRRWHATTVARLLKRAPSA